MRLGFSSNAYKKYSLAEAVADIAASGYGMVEIMADLHHALPSRFGPENRRDLRNQLADLGLTVSNVNAFTLFACGDTYHPTWIEPDTKERQRRSTTHSARSTWRPKSAAKPSRSNPAAR